MKIAVYFNLPAGGAKRALYEQLTRLSRNHAVDVYTLSSTNHTFCDLRSFIKNYFVYHFHQSGIFPMNLLYIYFSLPRLHKKIAEDINSKPYNVVLVYPDLFTQSPFILKYLKIPSVYFCQEPKREFYESIPRARKKITYTCTLPFRMPLKYIDRQNITRADMVLVNSNYSKDLIERIYNVKTYINSLGVDAELFKPLNGTKKGNIILSVGGFNLLKGHDFIIKSLAKIEKEKRPTFVIIGNGGEEKEYLKSLAQNLGVKLSLFEDVDDLELVKWYNKAKLFVYAPIKEPFGLAVLEAAVSGLPVLAVDEGGPIELLEKLKVSKLVKRDKTILSKYIVQMINEYKNIPKVNKDIDILTKNYSWDKSVKQLEKYLKMICLK